MSIINTDYISCSVAKSVINGNHCTVYGDRSVVNGDHCAVYGNNCIINGDNCKLYGENNIINGRGPRFMNTVIRSFRPAIEQKIVIPPEPETMILQVLNDMTDNATEDATKQCIICLTNEKIIAFQCGHLKTCATCSKILVKDKKPCPICRAQIKKVTKIFD